MRTGLEGYYADNGTYPSVVVYGGALDDPDIITSLDPQWQTLGSLLADYIKTMPTTGAPLIEFEDNDAYMIFIRTNNTFGHGGQPVRMLTPSPHWACMFANSYAISVPLNQSNSTYVNTDINTTFNYDANTYSVSANYVLFGGNVANPFPGSDIDCENTR